MSTDQTSTIITADDRRRLSRTFLAWTGRPDVVEDLTQETLVEVWRSARRPEDATELRAWTTGVARNVFLRWRREFARHGAREIVPETDALFDAASVADDLEARLTDDELRVLLDTLLSRVPPETRAALLLKYADDLPQAEVAARLNMHEKAVEGRLFRGRKALYRAALTHAPDEVVRLGLVKEADVWQDTGLWCASCGKRTMVARWSDDGHVWFDCTQCVSPYRPHGFRNRITDGWMDDDSRHLSFRRIMNRIEEANRGRFEDGLASRETCTQCGGIVTGAMHSPLQLEDGEIGMDMVFRCRECQRIACFNWAPGQGMTPTADGVRTEMLGPRFATIGGLTMVENRWRTLDGHRITHTVIDPASWRLVGTFTESL